MAALARGDAERLLRLVAEAGSIGGDEPFTEEFLVELGRLVPADSVTYSELDRVGKRHLCEVSRPGDGWDDSPGLDRVFWDVAIKEHPICLRHAQGIFGALKVSDFLTQRELHRTRLYDLWFRPFGVEHTLSVGIPSLPSHTKTFIFDRRRGQFSERDRLVLDLLQPHLDHLWRAARTRRLLAAALAGLDQAKAGESRGVLLVSARDELDYVSEPARRLLSEFAADGALAEWLEARCPRPLVLSLGGRRLIVERVGDALLVEETREPVSLTAREREVLGWVARGKTNPEIARILWLAPSTVSKHLANLYAKLGVKTRTAAVARFLGTTDVESSDGESSSSAPSGRTRHGGDG
jgi:DNA-binding CsgD family transcriptional regulator